MQVLTFSFKHTDTHRHTQTHTHTYHIDLDAYLDIPFYDYFSQNYCPLRHGPLAQERREFDIVESVEILRVSLS